MQCDVDAGGSGSIAIEAAPDRRSVGAGTQVLADLVPRWAAERGLGKPVAYVAPDNHAAPALWRSAGFGLDRPDLDSDEMHNLTRPLPDLPCGLRPALTTWPATAGTFSAP